MHHNLALRSKVIIMVSVMASLFLVALDQTIIATALGKIVEEFNAFNSLSWIVTAYLLTTTITVPIAGKLSDLFGRRLILLIGVAIFGIGSLLSGMSNDVTQLIFARAFQGIGGGIITANAFTIIGDLFEARERGKWQGMIGAVFGLASVVGPLLGGWLTDGQNIFGFITDWRWTFWINVPVAILAFLIISVFCPPLKHDRKTVVDYAGALLLAVALGTLVLAVDNTESIFKGVLDSTGWDIVTLRVIMCVIVIVSTIGFIVVERRAQEPIIPPRFFKSRNYNLIIAIAALFGAAFLGSILYLTQFNQQVFSASPTQSGLMLLPLIGGLMISSIASGQLISRTGHYKIFMQVGIIIAAVMVSLLATLSPAASFAYESVLIFLLGLGLGVVLPTLNLAVQSEFSQRDLGAATSSNQLFRSLGSTIGIAVFGAMLTAGLTSSLATVQNGDYVSALKQNLQASKIGDLSDPNTLLNLNSPDIKQKITDSFTSSVASLPAPAKGQAEKQFGNMQATFTTQVIEAFSTSLQRIFIISGIMMFFAAVLVFFIKERRLKEASASATPGIE